MNVTLSPVTMQLETDPGKEVTSQIKIRNNSSVEEKLKLSLLPFEADRSGDRPLLRDARPEDTYLSWVTFDQKEIIIQPSEWKTVTVTFSPPDDAALSYYFAIQIERTGSTKTPGETEIQGSPAILVLATVNSPFAEREIQLKDFSVQNTFLEFLPEEFVVRIENTGNVHVAPTGNIFIDGQGKKDLGIISVNPNSSSILPASTRNFTSVWDDGFPSYQEDDKEGTTQLRFDFSKADRLRFGRYTAHLLLVYDNGTRDVPIESFVHFWVVPIRLILLVLAVPLVPALLMYLFMRWRFARMRAALKEQTL